jgi:peptide/nickel transport system ATP-binding protein
MDLLRVHDLVTYFFTSKGVVKAVDGVSFQIEKRQMMGLVGESGCGKTTIGLSIMRLIEPPGRIVKGEVLLQGDNLLTKSEKAMEKVRGKSIALIPQSAMNALNPVFKVGKQIMEAIIVHEQADKVEAWDRTTQLLEMVGIRGNRVHDYPHEFSGGMKQRVVIAMALACHPDLLISDESTTGLDVMTQAQVLGLMKELQKELRMAMILISHDLPTVVDICDTVGIIYAGKLVELADISSFVARPLHPYSQGLMSSIPKIHGPWTRCESIPGFPPDLIAPPSGCRFHPRCPYAEDLCWGEEPSLAAIDGGRYLACHLKR